MLIRNVNTGQVCEMPDQLAKTLIDSKRFTKVATEKAMSEAERGQKNTKENEKNSSNFNIGNIFNRNKSK